MGNVRKDFALLTLSLLSVLNAELKITLMKCVYLASLFPAPQKPQLLMFQKLATSHDEQPQSTFPEGREFNTLFHIKSSFSNSLKF